MTKFEDNAANQQLLATANAYRGRRIPLDQAEDFLQDANYQAQAWHKQYTQDPHGPQLQVAAEAKAQAIRSQLYSAIDELSKSDPGAAAQLKRQYGALDALHDHVVKRLPVAARQAPFNLAEQGGLILGGLDLLTQAHDLKHLAAAPVPYLIARAARHVNSPEFLLKHSLSETTVPEPFRSAIRGAGRGGVVGSMVNSVTAAKPGTNPRIRYDENARQWVDMNTGLPVMQ
jgi:hypothetical protein